MKSKISPVVDKDLETVEPITTSTFREELNWDFMRSETLFGRSREIEQMSNVVRRRFKPCSRPELLLVSGYAGAGKTALVAQLRKIFEAQDVYFVSGKFDQMKRPEPYSTLMKTLTIFVAKILKSDEATIMKAEADILRAVQGEIGLLIRMIPNLKKLVGHHEYFELQGADVLDQLKNTFRKFISAACSSSRRLVFVMDDLQWADIGSLELLEAIVSDKKNHSIALVGICRTEEVSLSHDLAVILRKLEDEMETGIVNVDVGYLSMHSAVQLVSSVLHQPEGKCQFVTTTLHQKTKGNPLFLILLLKALYDKEVLVPDKESAQWLWDNDKWKLHFKNIENVVDLMLQRIEVSTLRDSIFLMYCSLSISLK
jgi:predicted ATPase